MPLDNTISAPLRRVSFKDNDEVLEIPCRRDSTEDERHAISFSSDDLKGMRNREKRLSEKLTMRGRINNLEDDMIGIFSFEDNSQRCKRIVDGRLSVLAAQENQYGSGGIRDHDCIAKKYSRAVNESKLLARHRGFYNAIQVEEEFKEDETSPMSSCPCIIQDPNPCRWDMQIADSDVGAIFEVARKPRTMQAPITRMIVIPIEDMLTLSS
ncbi:unnamed protein product [Cylindrotheca closterium]|uniref:Uncharacterized protein n=1 Tax=Cylindrotheca closterium TaxID=2856 RepID=A0AAD2FMF5_9STRA|nr:unnamed protein product [Cylindrotheca closterium]